MDAVSGVDSGGQVAGLIWVVSGLYAAMSQKSSIFAPINRDLAEQKYDSSNEETIIHTCNFIADVLHHYPGLYGRWSLWADEFQL